MSPVFEAFLSGIVLGCALGIALLYIGTALVEAHDRRRARRQRMRLVNVVDLAEFGRRAALQRGRR